MLLLLLVLLLELVKGMAALPALLLTADLATLLLDLRLLLQILPLGLFVGIGSRLIPVCVDRGGRVVNR